MARPPKKAPEQKFEIRLLRNYMPKAGGKKRLVGEILKLSKDEAKRCRDLGIGVLDHDPLAN